MCDQRIINDKVDAVYLLSLLRFVHCEPEGPWSDGLLLPRDAVAVLSQTSIFFALYEIRSEGATFGGSGRISRRSCRVSEGAGTLY